MEFALSAARWVVGKALAPVTEGLLEAWAASKKLGDEVDALTTELHYAQAMLNNTHGREIDNPALNELLLKLRLSAYDAEDVLDELDYFRIEDELEGTSKAANEHPGGCAHDLLLHVRATARSVCNKLKSEDPNMPGRGQRFLCGAWPSKVQERRQIAQAPKLKFNRVEVSTRMTEITQRLKPICAKVSTILNLELLGSKGATATAVERPTTTEEITEPKLYGRETKQQYVVDTINHGECRANELTVLSIVGPGGIGKTTFTQHVYKEVKSNFQVSIWICVSLNFNANRLAQEAVKKMPEVEGEKKYVSDQELIEQRLKGKRFLLVLDDIWKCQKDEWEKLLAPFRKGGEKGNMVIVTTRLPNVAKMTATPDDPVELERLEEHDLMSFFQDCVFGHKESWTSHPDLHDIGEKIVKKLKGSPLAAKTVGRLLKNQLTRGYWTRVLESKEWELQTDTNDIMPALKISYNYLPPNLQRCFSYCALFPEDYEFDRKELIHFWIGQDILHSDDQGRRIEDVGERYITNLVNYGFFKKSKKDNGRHYYIIHDLLHELAVKVSRYDCLSIHISNVWSIQIPTSVRHLSIIVDNEDVKDRLTLEARVMDVNRLEKRIKVENIRTLMLFGDSQSVENFVKTFGNLFKEATALRTIFLSGASYSVEDMLPNLSRFVHLRYLKIKRGYKKKISLPGSISRLYHLKVLDIQDCEGCSGPSRGLSNLVKIHHFIIPNNIWRRDLVVLIEDDRFPVPDNSNLHSNISKVGKLKLLRELRRFEVKKERNGFELKELGQLLELEKLGIYNLEKVEVKGEADEVKLKEKQHLQELVLDWDINRSNKDSMHEFEENILESLRPHSNLYRLSIKGHGGATCPSWLGVDLSVKDLECLQLSDVSWKNLPPLGEFWLVDEHGEDSRSYIQGQSFRNLKSLELAKISKLKKWIGNGSCEVLSHLELLIIRKCPELVELPFSHEDGREPKHGTNMTCFPKLQSLVIDDCPKLSSLPCIPWSSNASYANITNVDSGLERLYYVEAQDWLNIEGKDALDSAVWRVLAFHNLSKVKRMSVRTCPPLPLDHLKMLSSLESIDIGGSISWEGWTPLLPHFPKLLKVRVNWSENLTGLGVVGQENKTEAPARQPSSSVTDVEEAHIGQGQPQHDARGEVEIAAATSAGLLVLPSQIQTLDISTCPNLVFCPGSPDDKDKGPNGGGGGGLQGLSSLRRLWIQDCPRFLSSSSRFPLPSSMEDILLNESVAVDTVELLPVSKLSNLTRLSIYRCGDLRAEGLRPLLAQGHLTKLTVARTPKFLADLELPRSQGPEIEPPSSKLQELETDDVAAVLAAPICTFLASSLTKLEIFGNDEVERFTKEQEEALRLLTNLEELHFRCCGKLQLLPAGLHTLPRLKILKISYCRAIRSQLKVDDLPSSLQELDVQHSGGNKLRRQCRKFIGTIPIVNA